jgi:hypothetical protein
MQKNIILAPFHHTDKSERRKQLKNEYKIAGQQVPINVTNPTEMRNMMRNRMAPKGLLVAIGVNEDKINDLQILSTILSLVKK